MPCYWGGFKRPAASMKRECTGTSAGLVAGLSPHERGLMKKQKQNTPLTGSDGTQIYVYNPNTAYGPAPSCIQDWIPSGCTDQGTVFDETGEHEVQGTLPWVPFF